MLDGVRYFARFPDEGFRAGRSRATQVVGAANSKRRAPPSPEFLAVVNGLDAGIMTYPQTPVSDDLALDPGAIVRDWERLAMAIGLVAGLLLSIFAAGRLLMV
jgi:hypothetical protein